MVELLGIIIFSIVLTGFIGLFTIWVCIACIRERWNPWYPSPKTIHHEQTWPSARPLAVYLEPYTNFDTHSLSGSTVVNEPTSRPTSSPQNRPKSNVITRPSRGSRFLSSFYQRRHSNQLEDDDGGNESNAQEIELADIGSYPHRPFRENPGNYMTMGLRKLDIAHWLTIDKTYKEFHVARAHLLKTVNNEVIQCLGEGYEAAEELLALVVDFLTTTWRPYFRVVEREGKKMIRNRITKEELWIQNPYHMHPLEICARLAMEDFNILKKSPLTGEHALIGSATLFPAGWHLSERIGVRVTELHGPVPQWKSKLSSPVEHYFDRIRETSCMERSSFFIQTRTLNKSLADVLFVQDPKDFFSGNVGQLNPGYIMIRRERQTFRRLPKTEAIVFTVKTLMTPLTSLSVEERKGLVAEIRAWPEDIAEYKGIGVWGTPVLRFCEGLTPEVDDVTVYPETTVV